MKVKCCHSILILLLSFSSFSQSKLNQFLKPSDTLNLQRRNAVIISEASLAGLTLIGLNELWYKDHPSSKFHTLNDNNEWLQMDKIGHAFSSYQISKYGANILNWSGASKNDQLIYGSVLGFTFLSTVEVFDGFSQEWGFSWGDIAANTTGLSLFVGQELLWKEQRIAIKYSFHQTRFADKRPEKLGEGLFEELIKDYNGQTFWVSANLHSFFKGDKLPKWLNIAVGYGADGMLTGFNESDNQLFMNQNRFRQYYLSLDIDLSRIKTNSHVLRSILDIFNVFKIPFPTLEFNKNGAVFHLFYY